MSSPQELEELASRPERSPQPVARAATAPRDLPAVAERLMAMPGVSFADLFGVDAAERDGCVRLHVIWALDRMGRWLDLEVDLPADEPRYPALTPIVPAAGWYERELRDELGVEPEGHPLAARLRRPASWPDGSHLFRGDLTWTTPLEMRRHAEDEELPLLPAGPEGVVDYPLGPVRSGVVESGHYTLRTAGEEIVDFRLQLFYKHRGVEKRAEGFGLLHLPLVAERISGTSAFAHSLALCQAIEMATACAVPERAQKLRTLFAELERLYNHLGYHADLCQATGLAVGQAQFEILKERQLRLNATLCGHRYLFGVNVPGGVVYDLDAPQLLLVRRHLHELERDVEKLGGLLLESASHVDRLEGTGILRPEDAAAYGAVGPIGRASGVDRDLRRDHPYAAYGAVDFAVPVLDAGDAFARFQLRMAEIKESVRICEQVIDLMPDGPVQAELSARGGPPDCATGLGWAESPRGESLHWIALRPDGTAYRYRARPASFANWQAFPLAIPGHNILTDFPVIEQSFGLSFAGADR